MYIDLKNPQSFTYENVRKLIESVDDDRDWQLIVSKEGIAFLTDDMTYFVNNDFRFRLESWVRGNDYVGPNAAKDQNWVSRIYNALKKNWPNPSDTMIDIF